MLLLGLSPRCYFFFASTNCRFSSLLFVFCFFHVRELSRLSIGRYSVSLLSSEAVLVVLGLCRFVSHRLLHSQSLFYLFLFQRYPPACTTSCWVSCLSLCRASIPHSIHVLISFDVTLRTHISSCLGYENEVLSPLYQFFQPACARRVPTLHLQLPPQQPQQPFHATSFFP